jgi:hypothetical protein
LTIIEIIDTFTFYGVDVIALAALTCLFVQIAKLTIFKNCKKKILTFLPFIIGTLMYAAYAMACNLNFFYVFKNYSAVLEHGFAVGALSTVIYVWYEQFIREKKTVSTSASIIATLIDGYVPTDAIENIAEQIASAIEKDVTGNGAKKAAEILTENKAEEITEKDIALLSKLIIETLAHLAS